MKIKLNIFLIVIMMCCLILSPIVAADDNTDNVEGLKAYEGINFTNSPETVKEKIKDSDTIKTLLFGTTPHVFINDYKYLLEFKYYNDKLYRVEFRSIQEGADFFNTKVKDQQNILVNTITQQYGESDVQRKLSILDMDNQYISWSHLWEIDNIKRIKIGIGETEYNYYSVLWIEYLPIVKEIEAEKEKEKNESISNSSGNF